MGKKFEKLSKSQTVLLKWIFAKFRQRKTKIFHSILIRNLIGFCFLPPPPNLYLAALILGRE